MAFQEAFRTLMTETVQVEPFSGRDVTGEGKYGPTALFSARIMDNVAMMRDAQALERKGGYVVWLATTTTLSTSDRLTLPVGYDPRQPPILRVQRNFDNEGPHHVVLYT